ncbi:MAG: 6-phosphofructokinase [Byssovorax sp.]
MHLAVLTSGGDSPGMNAAIRTIAVAGINRGHRVSGVRRGYQGLLEGDISELRLAEIDSITHVGGTILGSSRSSEFPTISGQERAKLRLREHAIDALLVIGGNGSLTGAHLLGQDKPVTVLGLPASIDNDIGHSGLSIGVDTAVNTIVEACDRISDTARAHRRAFIVEVMGRRCGFLAMRAGIAAEADAILYGEGGLAEDDLVDHLRDVLRRAFAPGGYKRRALIIKSEGVSVPSSRLLLRLANHLAEDAPGVEIRETVLGHVVRGGNPSALDRVIAQRLAYAAVVACEQGAHDAMLAWEPPGAPGLETMDPSVRVVPLADVLAETARLLDGTSAILKRRMELLDQVKQLLAL